MAARNTGIARRFFQGEEGGEVKSVKAKGENTMEMKGSGGKNGGEGGLGER